ncbi:MAG TPA: hypothetical protein VIT91_18755 [Chthoniobacterales bacterium]
MNSPEKNRVVVRSTQRRDLWIAIATGALVLAAIIYGVLNLGTGAISSSINGIIVEKKFIPQEERQITIGSGGLQATDKSGVWLIKVRALSDGEIYNVWIDKETYDSLKIGDPYTIPKASVE